MDGVPVIKIDMCQASLGIGVMLILRLVRRFVSGARRALQGKGVILVDRIVGL
jgi:hypothetical protein